MALALPLAAVIGQRREACELADLAAGQDTQLGQFRHQSGSGLSGIGNHGLSHRSNAISDAFGSVKT